MRTHFITDKGLFSYMVPYSYIQDCRNPTPNTVQLNTTLVWVFQPRAMQCITIHETVCNPRKDFYFYHVCSKLARTKIGVILLFFNFYFPNFISSTLSAGKVQTSLNALVVRLEIWLEYLE